MQCTRILALLVILAAPVRSASAQPDRLVPVSDWAYEYVDRLQRRGYLLELNPTALPYTQGAISDALRRVPRRKLRGPERAWYRMLVDRFDPRDRRGRDTHVGGWLGAGAAAATNDRLDPLRYTDAGSPPLQAGNIRIFSRADLQIYLDRHPFVAELGLRHDLFFDGDPDGLDAVDRLYMRNEHAYAGVNTRFASIFLGRFNNQWAPYGQPAVLLGDNARSFDQVQLRLGGDRLALRSVLGELDAATLDGQFTGRANEDSEGGINRYLAAHRLDWRPSKRFAFSLSESVLYSGRSATPSLKFASPVHTYLFLVDNSPKNEEHNGLFAATAWTYWRRWTASVQFLLDDFDFVHRDEPSSVAVVGGLSYAAGSWIDVSGSVHAVTALAYNTHQAEGKYLFLNRGIASEFSDFVHVSLRTKIYPGAVPGLSVQPEFHLLRQGEADILDPFPDPSTGRKTILTGTVEQTMRLGSVLRYQPDPRVWMSADLGFNWTSSDRNQPGVDAVRFVGLLEFGLRLSLDRTYRLSF